MNNHQGLVVLLVGPPLSGKSTAADILESLGFKVFSTKKALEELSGTAETIKKGGVVGDAIVLQMFKERFPKHPQIVVDSPRSGEQIQWITENKKNHKIMTIHLTISGDEIWQRMRVAKSTERGSRNDDTPQALRKRLSEYERYFGQMIGLIKKNTEVIEIDASKNHHEIAREIIGIISSQLV